MVFATLIILCYAALEKGKGEHWWILLKRKINKFAQNVVFCVPWSHSLFKPWPKRLSTKEVCYKEYREPHIYVSVIVRVPQEKNMLSE